MCDKMEELVIESKPLDMTGGWDEQVNGKADKVEGNRKARISWAEQQKARKVAERRARRLMYSIMLGLALIVAGGITMNYVEGFPFPFAVGLATLGVAVYMFAIGWILGHKAR